MENTHNKADLHNKNNNINFFINELKERRNISKKSKAFRKNIDKIKKDELKRINEERNLQKDIINYKLNQLEAALSKNDSEQIKSVLIKLQNENVW